MGASEFDKIGRLAKLFRKLGAKGVVTGIGDDAAVLDAPTGKLVWTVDEQVEGSHFRRELVSWNDVGWRSFMAAASDVAAMAATPWCALSALSLPADFEDRALDELARGQEAAATAVGAPIVGGNLTRSPVVSVTTTLLGSCARAIERGGAREGDGLFICGPLGLASAGLAALERGSSDPDVAPAVAAWRRPMAQIDAGIVLAAVGAHAAIDISDGLTQDLAHLAHASGLRAVLDEAALFTHAGTSLHEAAAALAIDPLECILYGGEDYGLVAASDRDLPGFFRIGTLFAGKGISLTRGAAEEAIVPRGFDHFTT